MPKVAFTNRLRAWVPFFFGSTTLAASVYRTFARTHRHMAGHVGYALDDTYIHMAMAKNFAAHGVWGVTRHEFTSSTSSPLWTLLLGGFYALFGVNEIGPLVLNLAFAALLIYAMGRILLRLGVGVPAASVIVVLAVVFTPLLAMVWVGMEHTPHILLTIMLVHLASQALAREPVRRLRQMRREHVLLLLVAPFVTAIRYEGLFVVFVVAVLFLARRSVGYAFLLGIVAVLPVAAYGAISMYHGWWLLPNSVILRNRAPSAVLSSSALKFALGWVIGNLGRSGFLGILILATLFILLVRAMRNLPFWEPPHLFAVVLLGVLLLHLQFARVGHFYRYDAYLVALGIFTVGLNSVTLYRAGERRASRAITAAILALVCIPLAYWAKHGGATPSAVASAIGNIYDQQYQMGLFIRRYYGGQDVAVNDIGAVSYLADIRLLDIGGLANRDVAAAMKNRDPGPPHFTTTFIDSLARKRGTTLAIAYPGWFSSAGGLPARWVEVGTWTISDNLVCADSTVHIYATNRAETARLIADLRAFAPHLPATVRQAGAYTAR